MSNAGRLPKPWRIPYPALVNTCLSRSVRNLFQMGSFMPASISRQPVAIPAWSLPTLFTRSMISGSRAAFDPEELNRIAAVVLAWRIAHHGHDAYRHPGGTQRQGCRLDGEGHRRAIPGASRRAITSKEKSGGHHANR